MAKIIIEVIEKQKHTPHHIARLENNPNIQSAGTTRFSAIGVLVEQHQNLFNIEIKKKK